MLVAIGAWAGLLLPDYFAGERIISSGFALGAFHFRYYGLLQALALVFGYELTVALARRRQIDPAIVGDLLLWTVPLAYLLARMYYVVFTWSYYATQPWWKVFAVWEGGLAIHGGILGGVIGLWLFAKRCDLRLATLTDLLVPALVFGQALGRWGNFFNQEAFGGPTALPWKMFVAPEYRPLQFADAAFFHPTFLYESLADIVLFGVLLLLFRRREPTGVMTAVYLSGYAFARFFIEGLRTDSLYLGSFRVAQVVSVVLLLGALLWLFWINRVRKAGSREHK